MHHDRIACRLSKSALHVWMAGVVQISRHQHCAFAWQAIAWEFGFSFTENKEFEFLQAYSFTVKTQIGLVQVHKAIFFVSDELSDLNAGMVQTWVCPIEVQCQITKKRAQCLVQDDIIHIVTQFIACKTAYTLCYYGLYVHARLQLDICNAFRVYLYNIVCFLKDFRHHCQ